MSIRNFTIYNLIERNALLYANKIAWLEANKGTLLTFGEYKEKVDALAGGLQKKGVQKGDRIAVIGKNSMEFFLLYGVCAALGAIMLPINWRLSADEIYFNLKDCEPLYIVADSEYFEILDSIKPKLTFAKEFLSMESDSVNYPYIMQLSDKNEGFTAEDISYDDGFVIIHTAAVEGMPRGALLSHENVLCCNVHYNCKLQLSTADVHLNFLPLFHIGGLSMAYTAFHVGAVNINMPKFDARKAVELIEEKKVSFFFEFSPILASIIEEAEKSGKDISSLRSVTGLDSSETIEKYQKITGGLFYNLYGQTETSCLTTYGAYNECLGSAGKPVDFAMVTIRDEYDNIVNSGKPGEITVKGPVVFKGYWNKKKVNDYIFRNGWHHTGDLGLLDEEGYLWYKGRKPEKELIKPGGENVYPAEVEEAILKHPDVEKTVVFGVSDPKWKEGIKAVCLLKKGKTVSKSDLIKFVGERIASYKKPSYVEFIAEIPVDKNGNIDREKIKEMYSDSR